MELAVQVTLAIFAAGIIYHSGRLSVRVEHLEDWRDTIDERFETISTGITNIQQAIGARHKP